MLYDQIKKLLFTIQMFIIGFYQNTKSNYITLHFHEQMNHKFVFEHINKASKSKIYINDIKSKCYLIF